MRKFLVLAIILTLSLSLVWAAEGVKNTKQTAAPRAKSVEKAQVKVKSQSAPATKVRPAKEIENPLTIDPNAINEATESQEIQTAKPAKEQTTEIKSVEVPAGYVGEGIDKVAAEKNADAQRSPILEYLQGQAAPVENSEIAPISAPAIEEPKWEPQYGEKGEITNAPPVLYLDGRGNNEIPVSQGIITSTLLTQDFEGTWSAGTPPAGWTQIDNGTEGTPNLWWTDKWHKFYYLATGWNDTVMATNYTTVYLDTVQSTWLITPAFDLSTATACSVYFKQYYDNVSTTRDSANVMVSTDDGTTWVRVNTQKVDSSNPTRTWLNLASVITLPSTSTVKVGFWHFFGGVGGSPTTTNGWIVDSVTVKANGSNLFVQDFSNQMSGWFGNTPPAGWTILDNGIVASPKAWNNNDWNKRSTFSPASNAAAITFVGSNARREWEDDWLVSPTFTIGASVACTLSEAENYQNDTPNGVVLFPPNTPVYNHHGYVKISETTDGGTTWGPWQIVYDNWTINKGSSSSAKVIFKYSLNPWIGKTVRLGWHNVNTPDMGSGVWYFDDVLVTDYTPSTDNVGTMANTAPIIGIQGKNNAVKTRVFNNGVNTETFEDSVYIEQPQRSVKFFENFSNPQSWTGANPPINTAGAWAVLDSGSLADGWNNNDWHGVYLSGWADTVAMVYYSPLETENEYLVSPAFDLSTASTPHLTFNVFFDWWSTKDSMEVWGTVDNWATKNLVARYISADYGSSTAPAQPDYDISSWAANQATVKLAFRYKGYDGLTQYLDKIQVYQPLPATVVYQQGQTVTSLASGLTQDLTFATWDNPTVGTYSLRSFTTLATDGNAADNQIITPITAYAHTGTAGPDAGSYSFKDDITGGGPAYNWVDISSLGVPITFNFGTTDSRYSAGYALGFPFWYYGANKTRIFVAEDGYVSFDSLTSSASSNSAIPSSSTPNNLLALFWDDLRQGPVGQARFYTNNVDSAIVSLTNWTPYAAIDTTLRFDAQLILSKNDAKIKFQYRKFEPGITLSHTIGIENGTGLIGLQYVYNGAPMGNLPIPPLAITFAPMTDEIVASQLVSPKYLLVGSAFPVLGKFKNTGALTQLFDARVVVNNGSSDVMDTTITGFSLNSGDSVTVNFGTFTTAIAGTHVVTLYATNPGDENVANNTLATNVVSYAHDGVGGPDAGLYSWMDNTVVDPKAPTFGWIDMSAGTYVTFSSADDATSRVAMGAPFFFYGVMKDSITISTNGFASFDYLSSYYATEAVIPTAAVPNNLLAPIWDDLVLPGTSTGVRYWNDTANNRFVFEYINASFYESPAVASDTFDIQIILNRSDSSVVYQYREFGTALQTDVSIGIENATGSTGLQYYYMPTSLSGLGNYPYSGLAVKFYYTAPPVDAGVTSIDEPLAGIKSVGSSYDFKATATNFTSNAAVCNVEFYDGATLLGTATGINLAGFAAQQVTCPVQWTPATTGNHTLIAKTVLAGDANASNDQTSRVYFVFGASVTPPYSNDFETNNGGMLPTNEWEWGIPTYASGPTAAHSGTQLWGTDLDNTYDVSIQSTLYFPPLDLTAGVAPILKFWMWHYSESSYDGANLKISTNGGTTWTIVTTSVAYSGALSTANPTMSGQQAWWGQRAWTEVEFSLAPYVGSMLVAKIDFAADNLYNYAGFYVDDISVIEPPADDIGVTAILAPDTLTIQSFSWAVAARVHNFGSGTQTNVPVHYEIRDIANNLVYDQTYSLSTIGPGVDSTVIFPAWTPVEADTHRVVAYSVLVSDFDLSNDTTYRWTYTYPHVGTASGSRWTYADNVTGGGPAFNWVDIKSVGTELTFAGGTPADDGNSGMQDLGFSFRFFGGTYTRINVNVNGYLSFTDSTTVGSASYTNVAIPTAGAPNGLVGVIWDDMYLRTNAKVYKYYNAVENQFIVQYDSVEYYSPSGSDLGFEVIFDGDDNSIKMQYLYANLGSQTDVTVGLENATGTEGLAYDNNGQVGQTPFPGMAITWTFTPPQVDVAFDHVIGQIGVPGSLPVCANFTNTGADDGTVIANFEIRDASNAVVFNGTGSGTIPAGNSANICAAANWIAVAGTYTINVTSTAVDDGNTANNNGSGSFQVTTGVASYPENEDFESTTAVFPPDGWTILHYGTGDEPNATWIESTAYARSPVTSAFQDDGPSDAVKDEWLVMKPVDLTGAYQPLWKFYEIGNYFVEDYSPVHTFYICTGPIFDRNAAIQVGQHTPADHTMPAPNGALPDDGFALGDQFDLNAYVGQTVWCAFRYQGEFADEWWIDDVAVRGPIQYDATVLSIDAPFANTAAADGNDVLVTVTNLGYGTYNFDVSVVITGATTGEVYNHTVAATGVDQNEPVQVTFPDFIPPCLEQYTMTVTTLGVGDEDANNNSLTTFFDAFAFGMRMYTDGQTGYLIANDAEIDGNAARFSVPAGHTAVLNSALLYLYASNTYGLAGDITMYIWGVDGDGNMDPLNVLWTSAPIHVAGANGQIIPLSVDLSTSGVSPTADFFLGFTATVGAPALLIEGEDSQIDYTYNYTTRYLGNWYDDMLLWVSPLDKYIGCDYDLATSYLDVAPVSVVSPAATMIGVGPFPVTVNIANAGLTDFTNASATAVITGPGGIEFTSTVNSINILAGITSPISFGNWAPSAGFETYTVDVTVTLAGDQNSCNDFYSSASYILLGTIASEEDFDIDDGGFTEVISSGDPIWQWGADTGIDTPPSGDNVWGTILNDNYPVSACASLRSPAMTVSNNGGALAFYAWYMTEEDWDYCNVKISTDDGTTFSVLTPIGGYDSQDPNADNLCELLTGQFGFTGSHGSWQMKAFDLTGYEGESVIFSVDFASDAYEVDYGFYLDNFMLIEYPSSGCVYIPGDINGNNATNGIDVTYGVNYFKGGALPPVICDMCPQTQPFYAAGDVNASCTFNGIDITYFVSFLKGGPALQYCATCPPATLITAPAVIKPSTGLKARSSVNIER